MMENQVNPKVILLCSSIFLSAKLLILLDGIGMSIKRDDKDERQQLDLPPLMHPKLWPNAISPRRSNEFISNHSVILRPFSYLRLNGPTLSMNAFVQVCMISS
jgi:hypothetical protein